MSFSSRAEYKYIIDFETYRAILRDLNAFIMPDRYGDASGRYKIHSLYFDSRDKRFYWEKIDGEDNRRKLRIRAYYSLHSKDALGINFEIKKRAKDVISKVRLKITEDEALELVRHPHLQHKFLSKLSKKDKEALEYVVALIHIHKLRPVIVVAYQRQAFIGKYAPDLRITFDTNLTYRRSCFVLSKRGYDGYILPPNLVIMEVKFNGIVPSWVLDIIANYNLQHQAFSKYCGAMRDFTEPIKEII